MLNKNVVNSLLVLTLVTFTFLSGCKETKEVKVEEHVADVTPVPTTDDKNVNVDVNVQQPQQPAVQTKQTDIVVVDKGSKDIAVLNANIQKLQDQVKTSNEKAKADINKQIQQMNSEKAQLQKQVNELKIKNAQAQSTQNLDSTKQQYRDTVSTKLENFTKKFDDLKTKTADLNDMDKTQVDSDIGKMEDSKSQIETKLADIDGAPDAAKLKLVRTQIDNMLKDLDKKYNELVTTKLSSK